MYQMSMRETVTTCCGLNHVLKQFLAEAFNPHVTIGDRAFKEVIKVRGVHEVAEALIRYKWCQMRKVRDAGRSLALIYS